MVDYAALFSRNMPRAVAMPAGADAPAKYLFSITNAVPEVINFKAYLAAVGAGLDSGGPNALAGYPPPGGHTGLRELVAQRLAANRGFDADPADVFISDGAGGAISILLEGVYQPRRRYPGGGIHLYGQPADDAGTGRGTHSHRRGR